MALAPNSAIAESQVWMPQWVKRVMLISRQQAWNAIGTDAITVGLIYRSDKSRHRALHVFYPVPIRH